jgi:hypothetical protein
LRTLVAGTIAIAVALLSTTPARASDEAAAEALFNDAKKLAAAGRFAEACPKFAESNRLDRGAGTLIHLADCYEKNKQTASAWATFKDAANAAQALGRADWQKLATDRAAGLEPKLAKLTIKVQDPAEKIEVTRDGTPTSSASWGTALPVDAGTHRIHATAPGRKAFDASVVVKNDGESVEVVVPKLESGGDSGGAATSGGSSQKTIGFVVTGIGVVGLGVGAITGLMAIGKNNDAKELCPTGGKCASQEGVDANDSAKSLGTVSTIGFVAGGVAIAAGVVLVLTAPKSSESGGAAQAQRSIRLAPAAGPTGAGFALTGAF